MKNKIFVTGCAGFIGFHTARYLLNDGYDVVGFDNLNNYYDVGLKMSRLRVLEEYKNFSFTRAKLEDNEVMRNVFKKNSFDVVIHLAAQAGVRYSIKNPYDYISSNIVGFINILEACRNNDVKHLIYASSSSVYGANKKIPFEVKDNVDHPMSLYAATKKSNELMAHSYSSLYGLPCTGLRFFTVYGPWGRPDMAMFLFTKNIIEGRPIKVFNHGKMQRDFTYIDDITEGIVRLVHKGAPTPDKAWSGEYPTPGISYAPYRIYNIGNNKPIELEHFISILEEAIGKKAVKQYLPMQKGDVYKTYANVDDLINDCGFKPNTNLKTGVTRFVDWYKYYYNLDYCKNKVV